MCGTLTTAKASQIAGVTFTSATPSNTQGIIFECEYKGAGTELLQVSVQTKGGKYGYNDDIEALKAVHHEPNKVTGVGDEAFSMPDPKGNASSIGASAFACYGALFGDDYIQIGGLTYVDADQGKQIVELLDSQL